MIHKNIVDKEYKSDLIPVYCCTFEFLTVFDREDIKKGVEYVRDKVLEEKSSKRIDQKLFREFLDNNFIKTRLNENLIDMFN